MISVMKNEKKKQNPSFELVGHKCFYFKMFTQLEILKKIGLEHILNLSLWFSSSYRRPDTSFKIIEMFDRMIFNDYK